MNLRQKTFAYARQAARTTAVLMAGTLSATLLAGCGSTGTTKASNDVGSPSASSSPSLSADPQAAVKASILATYRGFWDTQIQAYAQASTKGVQMEKFMRGQADGAVRQTVDAYAKQHLVMRGRPQLSPRVTALNMNAKTPTATITDCVDTTNYITYNSDTGKPAATDHQYRHPWTVQAQLLGTQWWITQAVLDRSRSC
ncbi:hypothetical protein ACFQZC_38335 [Streptacidiphilus monticola]